ncbi:PSK operon transcription factor [Mesorhizobium sp. B2-3-3]|uniref:type II toxin-antitoxin system VapB family antitoxin n=1 Tax=unclassified Mesorhizobium TaxID=325217 RepID=UPI001129E83F|nr:MULTISPECIES: type II toxin-antitoxin system VapB family antitoxin [unclassified Mesorhizobium]TPK61509.1 PSK operon transcription factor [Mesorhizobium sp. B2-4-15]TPM25313.1 PSK operon transcription factor [Mesorhizobium sp. B2-3-5]TPN15925.1 PSK operon transcription factor [Mesorhizobium sp. B2-3-3]
MALSIKDRETELLARELAQRTGETITVATKRALEERLKRTGSDARKAALLEDLEAIRKRLNALPVLDDRTPDEIIGYDENGIPS